MPQVICRHSIPLRDSLGIAVTMIVADFVSTEKHPVPREEVDWLPQSNESGSICPDFALELRLVGHSDRRMRLDHAGALELKRLIAGIPDFPSNVDKDKPFLWIQFIDPDGPYV
ncbi:MAG: hypothetical protein AAB534_01945 [Patescibacteria group bacterium]